MAAVVVVHRIQFYMGGVVLGSCKHTPMKNNPPSWFEIATRTLTYGLNGPKKIVWSDITVCTLARCDNRRMRGPTACSADKQCRLWGM